MALRDPDLASASMQNLTCREGLVKFGKRMESRAQYATPPPSQRNTNDVQADAKLTCATWNGKWHPNESRVNLCPLQCVHGSLQPVRDEDLYHAYVFATRVTMHTFSLSGQPTAVLAEPWGC